MLGMPASRKGGTLSGGGGGGGQLKAQLANLNSFRNRLSGNKLLRQDWHLWSSWLQLLSVAFVGMGR